jgi:hypothetical protein
MDLQSPGGFAYECLPDVPGNNRGIVIGWGTDRSDRIVRVQWFWNW